MNKKKLRRIIVWTLMVGVICQTLWGGNATADAKEQENIVTKEISGQRKTRTQRISLGTEEQENTEEGWSWLKDADDPLSYTLTLDNVNFEVPDHSAISLYVNEGTPIRFINIVLIGENRIISTKQADYPYNGSGIYVNADDAAVKPGISIYGGGSLTVEGSRCGLCIPGCLNVEDVTLDARSDGKGAIVVGETLSMKNSTLRTNTMSAERLSAINCDITASMTVVSTQATSLITVGSCEIDDCTVKCTGPEGEDAYAAIYSASQDELKIKNSSLDIKNVDKGIYIQTGTITLEHITGALFCSNTGVYLNGNPALYANNVNVSDSTFYAQTGYDVYSWGDCSLPGELSELTVPGDLTIEAGKTFTIGEGQKVTFKRSPAYIKGEEGATLINNGTLEFTGSTRAQVQTQFVNNGTLIADGIDCDHTRFTNNGVFHGAINEKSGVVEYIYGKVTQGYNCSLGGTGNWITRRFITPGAELTILTGKKLDATGNGNITWDNLDEFLTVGEGGSIVVQEGAMLLLPADDTHQKVESLNLSGDGTVQIGDAVLHKVTYMDGADIWKSSFANGDNMVSEPAAPVKDGYIFGGWFTEPEGGEKFDFGSSIDGDLTLYARWDLRPVNVTLQTGSNVSVKDGEFLTYGQKLSELAFASVVFVEEGTDTEVAGTLRWKTPSATPKAGTVSAEWVFVPDDGSKYLEYSGTTTITVAKAIPYISALPTATQITHGDSLAGSALSGGMVQHSTLDSTTVAGSFAWKDTSIKPAVADSDTTDYVVVFTPFDKDNYESVEVLVKLSVKPAEQTPEQTPEPPSGSTDVPEQPQKPGDIVPEPVAEVVQSTQQPVILPYDLPEKVNDTGSQEKNFRKLRAMSKKQTKRSVTLRWKRVKGADGYKIYGNRFGKKWKYEHLKTVKGKRTSYTCKRIGKKKLKKGRFYKYIVIAYKTVDGKQVPVASSRRVYTVTSGGKYGVAKAVKVKKAKVSLKKGKSFKIRAKEVSADKKIKRWRRLSYESSNPKVASVSKKGVIKAKGRGSCKIYVYAQNGVYKTVKVSVR